MAAIPQFIQNVGTYANAAVESKSAGFLGVLMSLALGNPVTTLWLVFLGLQISVLMVKTWRRETRRWRWKREHPGATIPSELD